MKKTVLSLAIISLLFSCSDDDSSSAPVVQEQVLTVENIANNNFKRFNAVTSAVPVDVNEDGTSHTNVLVDEWDMCQRDDIFEFYTDQTVEILDGVDRSDYFDCTSENGTDDYVILSGTWEITGTDQITITHSNGTRTLVLENVILNADDAYLNNDSSEFIQFDIYNEIVDENLTYTLKN